MCWRTRQVTHPRFAPRDVELVDQFGPSSSRIDRPIRICNPADKNQELMLDSTAHEMCYALRESGFVRRRVVVQNQFGEQTLTVMRPSELCLPAEKDGIPLASPDLVNHFKCYDVRSTSGDRFEPRMVTVADQFETKEAILEKPISLCNPVDKNGEGVPDPGCHLVCYRLQDPARPIMEPRPVTVTDQFGTLDLLAISGSCRRVGVLCVPSTKTELPLQ
jgi:hypothetical protein